MAKGGWIYTPGPESVDLAVCIYCNLGLDGWEAGDDPTEEHSRRSKDLNCAFFNGLSSNGSARTILELTKDAFIKAKAAVEDQDVASIAVSQASALTSQARSRNSSIVVMKAEESVPERKRPLKRKLPKSRSKTALSALIDEEPVVLVAQEPLPIVLKSARKPRVENNLLDPASDDLSISPIKRARHIRTRSSSFVGNLNYVDLLPSPEPEKRKRHPSKVRNTRARTPLEDISDNNAEHITPVVDAIAEEEEVQPPKRQPKASAASTITKSDNQENAGLPVRGRKRASSDARSVSKAPRKRRSSAASRQQPLEIVISQTNNAENRIMNPDPAATATIQEEEEPADEFVEAPLIPSASDASAVTPPFDNNSEPKRGSLAHKSAVSTDSIQKHSRRHGSVDEPAAGLEDVLGSEPLPAAPVKRRSSTRRGSTYVPAIALEEVIKPVNKSRRSTSRRRGSTAVESNIESIISSAPTMPLKRKEPAARRSSSRTRSGVSSTEEAPISQSNSTRRSSSRRRGSATAGSTNIEEIVMLDYRAQPKAQRSRAKLVKPVEISTDSIQEQDEAEAEIQADGTTGLEAVEAQEVQPDVPSSKSASLALVPMQPLTEIAETVESLPTDTAIKRESTGVHDPELMQRSPEARPVPEPQQHGTFDYNDISMIEIMDTPRKVTVSSRWTDLPTNGIYDRAMLPATIVRHFTDLSEEEKEMTVEQWLRTYTKKEVATLGERCESMIERLIAGGQQAKAAILSM